MAEILILILALEQIINDEDIHFDQKTKGAIDQRLGLHATVNTKIVNT